MALFLLFKTFQHVNPYFFLNPLTHSHISSVKNSDDLSFSHRPQIVLFPASLTTFFNPVTPFFISS